MKQGRVPRVLGQPSPIRYGIDAIKQNRTYDQVLGDRPDGRGDPSLGLFLMRTGKHPDGTLASPKPRSLPVAMQEERQARQGFCEHRSPAGTDAQREGIGARRFLGSGYRVESRNQRWVPVAGTTTSLPATPGTGVHAPVATSSRCSKTRP